MGGCPDHEPELPDELARLGDRLEAAAAGQLASRRRRRRARIEAAVAVIIAVPLAIAAASTDVAPSDRPASAPAGAVTPVSSSLASTSFVLDRVPDEADATGGRPCVMVPDCRATANPPLYP